MVLPILSELSLNVTCCALSSVRRDSLASQCYSKHGPPFASCVNLQAISANVLAITHAPRTSRSHSFAGQLAGLLHPGGELRFVELIVLVDVEVAHFLVLGLAGRHRTQ